MKIVIVGAGEVGQHLAKLLSAEGQDITLVDKDADRLARIDSNYNLMTRVGSPTSFATLREARAGSSDLFIAVTPYEEKNLIACQIASSLGAKRTVARIDNFEYLNQANRAFFAARGVDHLIYPEVLAASEIRTALRRTWARQWFELHNGEIILAGVKLYDGCQLIGHKLRELSGVLQGAHVSAITRRHSTIIPGGNDIIEPADIVYFTITPDAIDHLRQVCDKHDTKVRNVMIMGGTRIAIRLADMLSDEYKIKIIDNNPEICRVLPGKCPGCEIIHGDGRDNDLLIEEGIEGMDAFIALSDSSETNILACLSAKEFGVNKTIAEVENIQFISEAEGLNIGTVINKKLLASSRIFQIMLAIDSESSKFLSLADAEVAEIEVKEGAKITKAPIKDLKFPGEMTIGGLVRDGKGMLVNGLTQIMPGDFVTVFCLSGNVHKIERLFN